MLVYVIVIVQNHFIYFFNLNFHCLPTEIYRAVFKTSSLPEGGVVHCFQIYYKYISNISSGTERRSRRRGSTCLPQHEHLLHWTGHMQSTMNDPSQVPLLEDTTRWSVSLVKNISSFLPQLFSSLSANLVFAWGFLGTHLAGYNAISRKALLHMEYKWHEYSWQ